jgi:hypothetical protein
MFHVWSGFRSRMSVFSIPLSWFKGVTNFVNNLVQGEGIEIEKPDNPKNDTPVRIKLSEQVLNTLKNIDELVVTQPPPATNSLPSGRVVTKSHANDLSTFTAGEVGGNGIKIHVVCRSTDDGATAGLHFREFTITSDGRIQFIAGENVGQLVFAAQ